MAAGLPVEQARTTCGRVARDREWRRSVHAAAREARRRARGARALSCEQRDRLLERRWTLWAAGWVADPPSYVPATWGLPPIDREELLAAAAAECRRAAGSLLRIFEHARGELPWDVAARAPSVIALCEVAAERLGEEADGDENGRRALLGTCARALDLLDASVDCERHGEAAVALALTCRTAASAIRRGLAGLHNAVA